MNAIEVATEAVLKLQREHPPERITAAMYAAVVLDSITELNRVVEFGRVKLNTMTGYCEFPDGTRTQLTKKLTILLELMMCRHPGSWVPLSTIERLVCKDRVESNTAVVHISNLRRALKPHLLLQCRQGFSCYRIVEPEKADVMPEVVPEVADRV